MQNKFCPKCKGTSWHLLYSQNAYQCKECNLIVTAAALKAYNDKLSSQIINSEKVTAPKRSNNPYRDAVNDLLKTIKQLATARTKDPSEVSEKELSDLLESIFIQTDEIINVQYLGVDFEYANKYAPETTEDPYNINDFNDLVPTPLPKPPPIPPGYEELYELATKPSYLEKFDEKVEALAKEGEMVNLKLNFDYKDLDKHNKLSKFVLKNSDPTNPVKQYITHDSKTCPECLKYQADFEAGLDSLVLAKNNHDPNTCPICAPIKKQLDAKNPLFNKSAST